MVIAARYLVKPSLTTSKPVIFSLLLWCYSYFINVSFIFFSFRLVIYSLLSFLKEWCRLVRSACSLCAAFPFNFWTKLPILRSLMWMSYRRCPPQLRTFQFPTVGNSNRRMYELVRYVFLLSLLPVKGKNFKWLIYITFKILVFWRTVEKVNKLSQ